MIGFCAELQKYKKETTEGFETCNLQKNELYDMVASDYLLPPLNTRGVTREYLLAVREGTVFRVANMEWRTFDFNLTKSHNKKVGVVNNSLLVKKLNILLRGRGQPQLGFTEFELPEQNWLFKVARFIDRTNLLEFFESAPFPEPPLDHNSSAISKIYYGRLYAGEWLFKLEAAKRNKKLWDVITEISEKKRMLSSLKVNVEVLEHELVSTREKVLKTDANLHDLIGQVAITYTAMSDPTITAEAVIAGGSAMTETMVKTLNNNAQL
jgi:hypothetical protein